MADVIGRVHRLLERPQHQIGQYPLFRSSFNRLDELLKIAEAGDAGFLQAEDARSERRNFFFHVDVRAFDDRGDGSDDRNADDDAEQRQKRAQLVRQDRCEGNVGGFNILVHEF